MPVLRPCSTALASALAAGSVPFVADLFAFFLQSGTGYHWTTWTSDLVVSGTTYTSLPKPALSHGPWSVSNTMEVPTLEIYLLSNDQTAFGPSTATLREQIQQGVFDGASVFWLRVFMPTPGDTTTYGTIQMFRGDVGQVSLQGAKAVIKVRGKNSRLAVNAPVNCYQPGCLHTFCDAGCTLSAGTFTFAFQVGRGGATQTLVSLDTAATAVPILKGATLTMTSGATAGLSRTIIDTQGGNVTMVLGYPLPAAPAIGDTLTIFSACDKQLSTCTNTYSNQVNFRGFPFMPNPDTTQAGV